MPIKKHKDYKIEVVRLNETMEYVKNVISLVESNREKFKAEIKDAYIHLDFLDSSLSYSSIMLNTKLLDNLENNYEQLLRIRKKPYFARMDVKQAGKSKIEQLYIGKVSLFDSSMEVPLVVDWRAPISSIYYDGRLGETSYEVENETQEVHLYLKRQYTIQEGHIETFMDVDISVTDAFLQASLESNAQDKLKDIVSTIQAEQNAIIRADINQPLIVQGVAGSGKTTIALHRIAYLMYTYAETFKPEQFMIIAPNRLFLDYISNVLPELGAEKANQTIYTDFMFQVLEKKYKLTNHNDKLMSLIDHTKGAHSVSTKELITKASHLKNSMHMKTVIDYYIEELKVNILPKEDFCIQDQVLLEKEKIAQMFLVEWVHLPLYKRVERIKKYLLKLLKAESKKIVYNISHVFDSQISKIRLQEKPTEERRLKLVALIDQRDSKIEYIIKNSKPLVTKYMKLFYTDDLLGHYKSIITDVNRMANNAPADISENVLNFICENAEEILKLKKIELDDLAPLAYLKQKLFGFKESLDIRYVVIDEAQDFSNFQFYVLKEILETDRFTILGDLSQGIHMYRGIHNWDYLCNHIFETESNFLVLEQSYRTTVEIMNTANQVINQGQLEGVVLAKPVVRHGEIPLIKSVTSKTDLIREVERQATSYKKDGFGSVAIIAKNPHECKTIQKLLNKNGIIAPKLLDEKEQHYNHDLVIIPSYLAKGLEFDAVIIVTMDAYYTKDALDLKLLYVAMTRALHQLSVFYLNDSMPVLNDVTGYEYTSQSNLS